MAWPARPLHTLNEANKKSVQEAVFRKCDGCRALVLGDHLAAHAEVCPECGHHHKLSTEGWRTLLLDPGSWSPWDTTLISTDPLEFSDGKPYPARLAAAKQNTSALEAIETGRACLAQHPIAYGAFLFPFLGGSMGSVVGEKITRLFEKACDEKLPVLLLQASGGARMQEGILSLMQMAKTVAARERLRNAKLPFFSVLLHPTTGGVAASFSFLGDVNLAEPHALIGFAGPRVIETTLRQTLPAGFQRSEFLLTHGMLDRVVPRTSMRQELAVLLRHLTQTQL